MFRKQCDLLLCIRSATAKKFLAAANFLEVLSVVSESSLSTTDAPEMVRYAKWKAADIAKAFREGRKPTPGGIGEQEQESHATDGPSGFAAEGEPSAPPSEVYSPTSPHGQIADLPQQELADSSVTPVSPDSWSMAATPGTPGGSDGIRSFSGGPYAQSALRRAWVSGELEGNDEVADVEMSGEHLGQGLGSVDRGVSPPSSDTSAKRVHFSPSVIGGLTPSTLGPETDPFRSVPPSAPSLPPSPVVEDHVPQGLIPSVPTIDKSEYVTDFVDQASPSLPTPPLPPPPLLPSIPPTFSPAPPAFPPAPPSFPPAPPMNSHPLHSQHTAYPPLAPPPVPVTADSTVTHMPVELTPSLIVRVQKHCKFAISSLDYEDAEQARKELRAALQLLGG